MNYKSNRQVAYFLLPLLLLTPSCFLNQGAPSTTSGATTPNAQGLIIMEDVTKLHPQAAILALFAAAPAPAGQGTSQSVSLRNDREYSLPVDGDFDTFSIASMLGLSALTSHQIQCGMGTVNTGPAIDSESLSAGNITFGAALQATMIPMDQDGANNYSKALDADVPPGPYQIKGDGSDKVAAFQDLLTMPENLKGVTLNGVGVVDDSQNLTVSRSQGLTIEWNEAFPNDLNQIVTELHVSGGDHQDLVLQCAAIENNLQAQRHSGKNSFKMPPAMFQKIPASAVTEIRVMRVQDHVGKAPGIQVEFQGLRRAVRYGQLTN